jgi:hypothetical protein
VRHDDGRDHCDTGNPRAQSRTRDQPPSSSHARPLDQPVDVAIAQPRIDAGADACQPPHEVI